MIIDIGSASIGGMLSNVGKGKAETIFSVREKIAREEEVNLERFFSNTLKSIDSVLDKIFKEKLPAPKKIFCILSSPWHVSEFRSIKLVKNTPFSFTHKMANELLRKEADLFQEERFSEYGDLNDGHMVPVELKTMKTALNGYFTSSPFGQKAKELDISIFISLAPREVLEKIKEIIGKHFHGAKIEFSSSLLVSFVSARDVLSEEDFLMIDVGEEITEVSMVKNGELKASASFPMGCGFFSRKTAKEKGFDISEAASLFSLHQRGHMEKNALRKIDPAIKKTKGEWTRKFENTLSQISNDVSVPSSVLLFTEPEFSEFFSSAVESEQAHQYDWAQEKFHVMSLPRDGLYMLYFHRLF